LEPGIDFLNHGSFGACPRPVLDAQRAYRDRLEAQPVRFYMRELEDLLAEARTALGRFIGAGPSDLALVPNATTAVNAVVRWLRLQEGDELLATDHAYNACLNALEAVAAREGARVIVAAVPFPIQTADQAVEAVMNRVSARTRLALIDHVTSPTALVFPVERIVRELATRGIDTLVDGAHAPGMLPLNLDALGAAYYTGNCHKWLCAPKGAAFLHVRRDRQDRVRPWTISHGANADLRGRTRYRVEFDWTGTDDPTAFLAVPHAIRFLETLVPGGWPALMERNRRLALQGRAMLCEALRLPPPAPDAMIGAMASVPIPDSGEPPPSSPFGTEELQQRLWQERRTEVPIMGWPRWPKRLVRISAQAYNTVEQYRRLAETLRGEFKIR
jgi:isopenicillin-N epimerase